MAVSPRAALAQDLATNLARLLAVGDTEAARVAHEAMGRLLAVMASGTGEVDLATERVRRAER